MLPEGTTPPRRSTILHRQRRAGKQSFADHMLNESTKRDQRLAELERTVEEQAAELKRAFELIGDLQARL